MKLLLTLTLLLLQNTPTEHANTRGGVAVSGYDLVTYFEQDEPSEGKKSIQTVQNGITYRFKSDVNKQKFLGNPEKYIPTYGGWCAYAMGATGEKVKIDPETYKIENGKLYLFYNFWGNNTLKSWNKDEMNLRSKADKYWAQIISSK